MRRRSLRRARKVLQESIQRGKVGATAKNDQHVNAGQGDLFSQTTVSSGASAGNISLATTGSYQDFAVCIFFKKVFFFPHFHFTSIVL